MNVYECNGANMFMSWKMECSIHWGDAELNGTSHLSTNKDIRTIAQIKNILYLFVLYNIQVDLFSILIGGYKF